MRRFVRTLAAGLAALAAAMQVQAGTCPAEQAGAAQLAARLHRMDAYFREPQSPSVFRALAGLGDPDVPPAEATEAVHYWFPSDKSDDAKLYSTLMPGSQYSHICRMTAPVETLRNRMARLGANHPYVNQWIAVERTVLSVCSAPYGKTVRPDLPNPLATRDAAVARLQAQDRAYQAAALAFYEGNTAQALKQFRRIAADKASPNRPNATYMVVAIEAGTNFKFYGKREPLVSSAQSLKQIAAILADPSLESVHVETAELIGWLGAVSPDDDVLVRARVREILSSLEAPPDRIRSDPVTRARYARALSDVAMLQGHYSDYPANWWATGAIPDDKTTSRAMALATGKDELARWIVQPPNPYITEPWLLRRIDGSAQDSANSAHTDAFGPKNPWPYLVEGASRGRLEDEIAQVKSCDDGVATASLGFDYYITVRELVAAPNWDTAARAKDFAEALALMQDFPFKETAVHAAVVHDSLQYLINGGYLTMARKVRDALGLAGGDLLIVLAEDEDHLVASLKGKLYSPPEYLNSLSTAELWRLAAREELDPGLRALIARTVWTRTYALGRVVAGTNDGLMRKLNPEMTADWRSPAGRDVRPDDRRVLADVLKSPALNLVMQVWARMPGRSREDGGYVGMDHYNHNDNNWWCAWEPDRHARDLDDTLRHAFGRASETDWRDDDSLDVRADQAGVDQGYANGMSLRQLLQPALRESFVFRNIDRDELDALSKVDCAPKMLTLRVIDWVKNAGLLGPRKGQAEALADAVATARWGCTRDGSHADYSRAAWQLLHDKFPDSEAAKRTRYWFSCPLAYEGKCPQNDPLATPALR